jgi:hypothetical protein
VGSSNRVLQLAGMRILTYRRIRHGTAVMRGRVVASTTLLAFPPAEYSTTEIVDVITREI